MTSIIRRHSLGVGAPATGAEQHHAGVVDEDVEAAESVMRAARRTVRLRLVGDVDLDRDRGAALAVDLLGEVVEPVLAAGAERDARALARPAPSAVASPIPDDAPVMQRLASVERSGHRARRWLAGLVVR